MAHYGEAYQNLCNVQKALIALVLKETEDLKGAASCAREVVAIESYKRELRGQARLKPVDAIRNLRPAHATLESPLELTTEPEPSKESLKNAFEPTVTAPPTPDAHGHQW